MSSLYLIIDLGSVLIPFIFSFHPKLNFYKTWKQFIPAIRTVAILFICWDIYYTKIGVWGFNPKYLIGQYLFGLPIEEILFFICIPYCCLFTYHCLKLLVQKDYFYKVERWITLILIIFLITVAIVNYTKLYTGVTFALLAILLVALKYFFKVEWLSRFYFAYLILLIPFLITNGILTGSGLEEAIVWYNDQENLGIRILTIPFEDIFYGMLMILLNVSIYEFLLRKKNV